MRLDLTFQALVRVRYLGETTHDHLTTQAARLTNGVVPRFVKVELTKNLVFPRIVRQGLAHFVSLRDGGKQRVGLLGRGQQFDFGSQLHGPNVIQFSNKRTKTKLFFHPDSLSLTAGAIPPPDQSGCFLASIS